MCITCPFAACHVGLLVELPVIMIGMRPVVTAKINGVDANFLADSGAFFSMLSPAGASEADITLAKVKVFTLAGIPIPNVEFLVGGGAVGLLGQNVFGFSDVEYDLGKGLIRLMGVHDCNNTDLAYWVGQGESFSMVDMLKTTPQAPSISGTAYVSGVKIRVIFDTDTTTSVLSLQAAQRAGIKVDSTGVVYGGDFWGIGRATFKSWIAPVDNLKIGDEEINHTRLRISDSVLGSADMLLGANFFLSHPGYVARQQNRLYFTYNGGPVFNLKSASPGWALSRRRGAALAARHDLEEAIADFTRACQLAPTEANYFYERGVAYQDSKQWVAAMTDLDRTLQLKPERIPALVARAELRVERNEWVLAVADLDAVTRIAAKDADARLRMAMAYAIAGHLPQAIDQLKLWIDTHGMSP